MSKQSNTESGNQDRAQGKPRKGRLFRVIKHTVLFSLAAVALIVGTAFFLAHSEPAHWKDHQQFLAETSPEQIEALAVQVDDKLKALANLGLEPDLAESDPAAQTLRSLTHPGDTETGNGEQAKQGTKPEDVHINTEKTITLNNEELAAVVQTRIDEWIQERGYSKPPELQDPMIAAKGGELVMAFRFQSGGFAAVISGKFMLNILDNGMAELSLKRFFVGQLPVPVDALGEHLRESSGGDERAEQVGEWLGKLQYLQIKPVLELEHRRRARVMDYKLLEEGLELQVRIQDHQTYKDMNEALAGVPTD
jgi:hypothetical protein